MKKSSSITSVILASVLIVGSLFVAIAPAHALRPCSDYGPDDTIPAENCDPGGPVTTGSTATVGSTGSTKTVGDTGSTKTVGDTGSTKTVGNTGRTNTPYKKPGTFTITNPLKVSSVGALVQTGLEVFTYLVVLLAVLALVYVGFLFVMARGNSDKIKEYREWLWYIIIGVAVVLGANAMLRVVINTLGATGTINEGVIRSAKDALPR